MASNTLDNVSFALGGTEVQVVDQRQLPNELAYLYLSTPQECYNAIEDLAVRGAPTIGVFCAHALAVLVPQLPADNYQQLSEEAHKLADYLVSSRPTAVNLRWAAERMMAVVDAAGPTAGSAASEDSDPAVDLATDPATWPRVRGQLYRDLHAQAFAIKAKEEASCEAIAEHALSLLHDGDGIITHCNAGPLAACYPGTALGPILVGAQRGMTFHVFASETRPLMQGARLTAYELAHAGVDVTVMCDNMTSTLMGQGRVQACLVGADRVAANGDVANKIGTNNLAIVAAHYGVPFYVLCPTSTIDVQCARGLDIPIEQRDPSEVSHHGFTQPTVPEGVDCFNPAFDITDHNLVTAIITQEGIHRPPYHFS